jgi:hypothetical protein
MNSPLTYATKCWGGDYEKFLSGAFDRKALGEFYDKYLIINNGVPDNVKFPMKTYKVSESATEVLNHFDLDEGSFTENGHNGYNYSIAELTAIYKCNTKYLCWVQGDCVTEGDWVKRATDILEKEKQISVVSPYSEVNTYGELDMMFSDQAFVIRADEFNKKIYNFTTPELDNYPDYGGNSFEKMVGRYLHNTGQRRLILYENYTHHEAY